MRVKIKKRTLIVTGVFGFFLAGCTPIKDAEVATDVTTETGSEQMENEETILYHAVVEERPEGEESDRLFVSNLTPVNKELDYPSYDEVILLIGENSSITREETGEKMTIEEIKEGTTITVELIENPPMTMSIPPQIPGNAIISITVSK